MSLTDIGDDRGGAFLRLTANFAMEAAFAPGNRGDFVWIAFLMDGHGIRGREEGLDGADRDEVRGNLGG